jgi:hypothetical protein
MNSELPRRPRFARLFLLAPLAVGCGFFPLQVSGVVEEAAQQQQSMPHPEHKIPPASELRELPPDEYKKLRAQALANSKVVFRQSDTISQVPVSAFDPAILSVLEQEHAYFEVYKKARLARLSAPPERTTPVARLHRSSQPSDRSVNPRVAVQPDVVRASPGENAPNLVAEKICRGPAVFSVDGVSKGVVFTQDRVHAEYIIEGCSFGTEKGQVQLEPHPTVNSLRANKPITLEVAFHSNWSDNEIVASIDPNLTGVPDLPVTLVIYPAKGRRIEMPGAAFVSARDTPKLLTIIPSSWVKLDASRTRFRSVNQLEYVSPPVKGEDVPEDAIGTSAFVVRSDSKKFAPGKDTFDLSHLLNGWVIHHVEPQIYSVSCPGLTTGAESLGQWRFDHDAHTVTTIWARDCCASYVPPLFSFNICASQYALKIWVTGPIGTNYMPPNEHWDMKTGARVRRGTEITRNSLRGEN